MSGNHKKLAVVWFTELSNIIDEIGIKFGIINRNKKAGESLTKYIKKINLVSNQNFDFSLIPEEITSKINIIEAQFIKRRGVLEFDITKEIIKIYYDLRMIKVPNVYESFSDDNLVQDTNLGLFEFFSSNNSKAKSQSDKVNQLALYELEQKEHLVQQELKKGYDFELFRKAIYYKKMRKNLKSQNIDKIEIKGSLRENISYNITLESILGYYLIGLFILFFLIGLVIAIEAYTFPSLTGPFSILLLFSFALSGLFFGLYWYNFEKVKTS